MARTRVLLALGAANLILTGMTVAFIYAWARFETYSGAAQQLIKYVLVHGHLATENVVAAWYSSMLLLTVGLAALAAYTSDTRRRAGRLRYGWLVMSVAFVALSLDEIGSFHERLGMVRALGGSSDRPMGWAYVFAPAIAAAASFLLAFAWVHVRTFPSAFWQMAAGVALFAVNPFFERAEMTLIHGGAAVGTWPRLVHDALLVVEEGVLELFGTLCFLSGVITYVAGTSGGRLHWHLTRRSGAALVALLTAILTAGVPVSSLAAARLPAGDTGIPWNWFPATAFFLLTTLCVLRDAATDHRVPMRAVAVLGLAMSACFGAGIHGYTDWAIAIGGPPVAMAATIAAGAAAIVVMRIQTETLEGGGSA